MQMLYQSDDYVVVQFDASGRSGFEIVDRSSRREIYIEGLLAESFKAGVQSIVDAQGSSEAVDEFIGRYTVLAQQPVVVH